MEKRVAGEEQSVEQPDDGKSEQGGGASGLGVEFQAPHGGLDAMMTAMESVCAPEQRQGNRAVGEGPEQQRVVDSLREPPGLLHRARFGEDRERSHRERHEEYGGHQGPKEEQAPRELTAGRGRGREGWWRRLTDGGEEGQAQEQPSARDHEE